MRPGPCRLPARTRFGGLSTIDIKLGSSAGSAFARRVLWEICRHDGHVDAIGLLVLEMPRVYLKLRACRNSVFEAFMVGDVLTEESLDRVGIISMEFRMFARIANILATITMPSRSSSTSPSKHSSF
jgi:hypothetical protein